MHNWIRNYIDAQKQALDTIPADAVEQLVNLLADTHRNDRQIFVFGNGGSAANASHFATDLGKGSSDALGKRFRILSLNDNTPWLTALGNDYSYDDIFVRQIENFARSGDLLITMSVSGNSPNLVKAVEWGKANGMETVAMVGGKRGRLAEIARHVIAVEDTHYGRVEDCHMGICHLAAYAFMERDEFKQG